MAREFDVVRRELLYEIENKISHLGYSLMKTKNTFRMKSKKTEFTIIISFYAKFKSQCDVSLRSAIRMNEIEDIISSYTIYSDERLAKSMVTISSWINASEVGGYQQWSLSNNVQEVATTLSYIIGSVAKVFFDQYSSNEAIFNLCVRDDADVQKFCPGDLKRAKNALVAAYLLHKQEEFDQLVERKRAFIQLQSCMKPDLSEFDTLVTGLKQRWNEAGK